MQLKLKIYQDKDDESLKPPMENLLPKNDYSNHC